MEASEFVGFYCHLFIYFYFFVNLPIWACECNDLPLPRPAGLGVRGLFVGVLFVSAQVRNSFNPSDYMSLFVCLGLCVRVEGLFFLE